MFKTKKYTLALLCGIIALILFILGLVVLMGLPASQKWLVETYLDKLSKDLNTEISFTDAKIDVFNGIHFDNLYIEDQQGDTLLYARYFDGAIKRLDPFGPALQLGDLVLEDVWFNGYRIDKSTYNFQFLIDHFKGEKKEKEDTTKNPINFDLGLEQVLLKNIRFNLNDDFDEKWMTVNLDELHAQVDTLNLRKTTLDLDSLKITAPYFSLIDNQKSDDDEEEEKEEEKKEELDNVPFKFLDMGDWRFLSDAVELAEGTCIIQLGKPVFVNNGSIDYKNLDITNINAKSNTFVFEEDTIRTQVESASLEEISGFKLNNATTALTFSDTYLHLKDYKFKTPYSELQNDLEFKYRELVDWEDFPNTVKMKLNFEDSRIGIKDIEYFIPNLAEKLDPVTKLRELNLSGKIKGKVNNLRGDDIVVKAGDFTYMEGRVRLRGLPDIENTFIDFKLNKLQTRTEDILAFFPKLKFPKGYEKLGLIDFKGTFTGFPNDFVADGVMQTEIGTVTTDLNMEIDNIARYSGDLKLKDFDLKKFLNNEQFGIASFSSTINGQGLRTDELNVRIKGNIERFDYKGYEYNNILVDGSVDRKLFRGLFIANDENFDLNFEGEVDFNEEVPQFGFKTDVFAMDLQKLNLIKEPMTISGKADLDFVGNNIDNIVGTGDFSSFRVTRGDSTYHFKDVAFVSAIDSSGRNLELESEELSAYFQGDFSFKELPNKLKRFLNIYFPYRFAETYASDNDAIIDFGIEIHKPLGFTTLFHHNFKYLSEGSIEGSFNDAYRELSLDVDIPKAIYSNIQFDSLKLQAQSNVNSLNAQVDLRKLSSGSQYLNYISLEGEVFRDTIDFDLQVEKDSAFNNLRFDGQVYTHSDTLSLDVRTMDLKVANEHWVAEEGLLVFLNQDNYYLEDFQLEHENQTVSLQAIASELINKNEAQVNIGGIDLSELMQLLNQEGLQMDGKASGFVKAQNPFGAPVFTGDITVDDFVFKNQLLGQTILKAEKLPKATVVDLSASVEGEGYKLQASGVFDMGIVGVKEDDFLDLDVEIDTASLDFMEGLITDAISQTHGWGKGEVTVSGNPTSPDLLGQLEVYDAGTTINFTHTHYTADTSLVFFKEKDIIFKDIVLNDKYNNIALVNGVLDLNDYKRLSIDAIAKSDNFLFLDTKRADNEVFYGTALASGQVTFKGPFSNINMGINASSNKGTVLYIPVSYGTEVSEQNFFTFINKNENGEIEEAPKIKSSSVLNVLMELNITPDAEIQLIFDYYAGDIIRSRGYGDIQMDYATNDDFKMYGNYTIERGDYLFTLQNIVNKKFDLQKGGTINFYGDPYNALIDINAVYTVKNTSMAEFMSEDELLGVNNSSQLVDTDVLLKLQGVLSQPNPQFKIVIPDRGLGINNSASRAIDAINRDQDQSELNRQVFGLLVFNEFLPRQSLLSNDFLQESITTTVSEFLSNQVTSLLSQTIQEFIPNSDLSFNWINYESNVLSPTNGSLWDDRNEIELVFTKRFFNDRVIIDIGGNVDVGSTGNNDNWDAIISDFIVQYKITEDGKYFLKIFSKTERDFLVGTYKRAGLSLYLSEEFDNFGELRSLFKKRRAQRKKRKALKKAEKEAQAKKQAQERKESQAELNSNVEND